MPTFQLNKLIRDKLPAFYESVGQKAKNEYKGGFEKGIYLETLELQANDTWIDYYRATPDRFPEIKK